jgi:hypothetical protein
MNVLAAKKLTDRVISMAVSSRNGLHRSVPGTATARRAGRARCWWRSSTKPVSMAGGMNSAVAPRPSASSAGVASTGAWKKPTLPPAAKTLIADALPAAACRAAFPAAGWNIATPSPDANSSSHTTA